MNASLLQEGLDDALNRGEILLQSADDDQYARKVPEAYGASIGGHYRHCLDHFSSLLVGITTGEIDYDLRERDASIETSRRCALDRTQELRQEAASLLPDSIFRTIQVRNGISYKNAATAIVPSSVAREVVFCVSHTVHHFALIGVICRVMGIELPETFGFAPSTLKHQRDSALAAA